jgi:hypothetical protein
MRVPVADFQLSVYAVLDLACWNSYHQVLTKEAKGVRVGRE